MTPFLGGFWYKILIKLTKLLRRMSKSQLKFLYFVETTTTTSTTTTSTMMATTTTTESTFDLTVHGYKINTFRWDHSSRPSGQLSVL